MLQKVKYAGICADMRGFRHFWRKVPEMREGGWKRLLTPGLAFGLWRREQLATLQLGLKHQCLRHRHGSYRSIVSQPLDLPAEDLREEHVLA